MSFYYSTFAYVSSKEQDKLMDIVYAEQVKRGVHPDNYNVQDEAMRQAQADGAMRIN